LYQIENGWLKGSNCKEPALFMPILDQKGNFVSLRALPISQLKDELPRAQLVYGERGQSREAETYVYLEENLTRGKLDGKTLIIAFNELEALTLEERYHYDNSFVVIGLNGDYGLKKSVIERIVKCRPEKILISLPAEKRDKLAADHQELINQFKAQYKRLPKDEFKDLFKDFVYGITYEPKQPQQPAVKAT